MFGLESLEIGHRAADKAVFLEEILPLDNDPVSLGYVQLDSGKVVDIHLIPYNRDDWVVLLDKTKEAKWQGYVRQKFNESELLRHNLSSLKQDKNSPQACQNTEISKMINYSDVLNLLTLEKMDDGSFRVLGSVPAAMGSIYPEVMQIKESLHPDRQFPFLENFLIDAHLLWNSIGSGRKKSGPWIEVDSSGNECALEVSAVLWESRKILMIEMLDSAYQEHHTFLQMGRENALANEYLEKEVRRRTADVRRREEEIIQRLVWAAEFRDEGETGSHIRRIGLYSHAMAETIGWGQNEIDKIRIASTMHDVGKIGIPDAILRKPGQLTPAEYKIMKTHTLIGWKILAGSEAPLLQMASDIALYHHEQWDGSGYPHGLVGEKIPLSARIVAIADVFDALVKVRVYKPAWTVDQAVATMESEKGQRFDPVLFETFMQLLDKFQIISAENSPQLFKGIPEGACIDV